MLNEKKDLKKVLKENPLKKTVLELCLQPAWLDLRLLARGGPGVAMIGRCKTILNLAV